MPSTTITIVGGGLGGLVASIAAAEAGAHVELYEAHSLLGGRGRSSQPPFVANLGPHVLYCDGPMWAWLSERELLPAYASPPVAGLRLRWRGELRRVPPRAMVAALPGFLRHREAPVDVSFHDWVAVNHGDGAADALSNFVGVATFTADPGALSASFVWERLRRVLRLPPAARYVIGGWSSLVERLAKRAGELGVRIHLQSPVHELQGLARPVIIATELSVARRLLADDLLRWTSGRAALLDVGLTAQRGDPFIVSDLDEAGWVERFSAPDATLAPPGHSLVQAQIGVRAGEHMDGAVKRIEALLDMGFADWRDREVWRRSLVEGRTGALDPPGMTWRDRPSIERDDGVFLCGDSVAAPGLLSEVAWASAVAAANQASGFQPPPVVTRRSTS